MTEITHINDSGEANMVDVSRKEPTFRTAVSAGTVHLKPAVIELIRSGGTKKGDVLATARIAGIMAAKKTSELIPLCHPLAIDHVEIDFEMHKDRIEIKSKVTIEGKTGVEMEALTAVSVAALTIYDMCKSADKDMIIGMIRLVEKTGGRSGSCQREDM